MGCIEFHLSGPFRVIGPNGIDLTPKGAKERGLLLLLLSQGAHMRARVWIQDKLWSDRGREQGAASLRQALAQIRRAFGDFQDSLICSRLEVKLDITKVSIVEDGSGEFAEGLDVRDEEFEHWLTTERSARSQNPTKLMQHESSLGPALCGAKPQTISLKSKSNNWLTNLVGDGLALSLRELFSKDVIRADIEDKKSGDWEIEVEAFSPSESQIGVRIEIAESLSRRQIWSGHRIVEPGGAPPIDHPGIVQLVNEAVEAVGDTSFSAAAFDREDCNDADALCRKGIKLVFSMEPEKAREADRCFEKSYMISGRGLCLAWRAQLRTIQRIERHRTDINALAEEGAELAAHALEIEPKNSMVLAMLANSRLFLHDDPAGSLELSTKSAIINPANPMAWWALSSAQLYCGNTKTAYQNAIKARHLARLSEHRFWWDLQQFASAMGVGKLDEATDLLERASAQCPTFRPPFRYLVALYAHAGKETRATDTIKRLSELESDFSIDRMLGDENYPTSLLRRTHVLDLERVAALR